MSFRFQIEAREDKARTGRFFTPHGEVETPVFMPVGTVATVKGVPQDVLEELGVQILLNNTYHLYLRPGVEMVRRLGGVQRFMAWDKPILTDSGGFQVFSLSDLRKVTEDGVMFRSHLDGSSHFFSPENSMAAQIGLGADIIMAFDECTEHPAEYARTKASMAMTLRWAERSKRYFEEHQHEVPWFRGLKPALVSGAGRDGAPEGAPLLHGDGAPESADYRGGGASSVAGDGAAERADYRGGAVPAVTGGGAPESADYRDGGAFSDGGGNPRPRPKEGLARGTLQGDATSGGSSDRGHSNVEPGSTQTLFGIVQGGMFPDLRRESAQRTVELDFPGYAIGGLSVGEPRPMTYEMVDNAIRYLPEDKPRYLMGVGTPEEIVHYVAQGVDMMDCVLPTRAARHGLLFTSEGRLTIKNARFAADEGPLDPACGCKVCARYSRAYLRHLYASNELLAQVLNTVHNLAYYLDTMRRVRQAIRLREFARFLSGVRPPHLAPESEQR